MQKDDFQWFKEHYDELYTRYGNVYLAIKDKTVLGSYATFGDGVRETAKTEQPGTFIVQYCDGTQSAYRNHIASMNFMPQTQRFV